MSALPPVSLKGRVLLVTGGTQGIGEGIARAAAEAGAAGICITGRDVARGRAVVDALGVPACFVAADLADAAATARIVDQAEAALGPVDGLVNAAGLTDRGTLLDTPVELWDRLFAVNTRAPFILTQALARRLVALGRPGAVVNVITMSSHGGQPFLTAYSSSKGALATFTRNSANGLRRARIRVNGINIGWADTPGEHAIQARDGRPADWLERAEPSQPFGRLIRPRDVAGLAVYLLSDAAEMMTGALIDFDQNVMGTYE
ncbi:SDR family oxidoreductase [Roseomonas sp. PWR1]|uniref:SDR family oxidoreductase n=1 Tax=Roseomonas nitratireducens TaxID=2820810 RepID=A0ABS4ARI9_9PROT|nr:SDR family oxidoreductase [Neoroseomonas nitratireducens]MBP0463468.1 SDR family oxidoreductase [Neoroseomonas nitratireducens]